MAVIQGPEKGPGAGVLWVSSAIIWALDKQNGDRGIRVLERDVAKTKAVIRDIEQAVS